MLAVKVGSDSKGKVAVSPVTGHAATRAGSDIPGHVGLSPVTGHAATCSLPPSAPSGLLEVLLLASPLLPAPQMPLDPLEHTPAKHSRGQSPAEDKRYTK